MSSTHRIVVTGLGVATAAGIGASEYAASLRNGKAGIQNISTARLSLSNAQIAGRIDTCGASDEPRLDYLANISLREALSDSGYPLDRTEMGLIFATAISTTLEMERAFLRNAKLSSDDVRFGAYAEKTARDLSLGGPNLTVATGCTAGIDALGIAVDQLRQGRCKAAVIVAADATLSPIVFAAFDQIGALSKRNDVNSSSQPFGTQRDGFVLAEGSAAVVLETLASAKSRKAQILAEVISVRSISNAFHMTSMRTDGSDLMKLFDDLLAGAKVRPADIGIVDVHGTSTVINDLSEANAINGYFGVRGLKPFITAQKALTGHSLGASNLIEIVGLILMLDGGFIPGLPTARFVDSCLSIQVNGQTQECTPAPYALKVSSSFSGMHSGALFRAVPPGAPEF